MSGLGRPPIGQTLADNQGNMTRSWQSWIAQMYEQIKDQPFTDVTVYEEAPLTGFNYVFDNQTGALLLKPAGTLATGTIHLPPLPVNGQVVRISTTQTITALTLDVATGQTLNGGVTTLAAGQRIAYIYLAKGSAWYPY